MRKKILWLTFWVTMAFWFGFGTLGCHRINESAGLHHADPVPALDASSETGTVSFSGAYAIESLGDRADWPVTTVRVAFGEPKTRPVYWKSYRYHSPGVAREVGRYPTTETALQINDSAEDDQRQYLEMVVDPAVQFFNFFAAPVRAFTNERPREFHYGARGWYESRPGGATPVDLFGVGEEE